MRTIVYRILDCTDCGGPMQVPGRAVGWRFGGPRGHQVMAVPC